MDARDAPRILVVDDERPVTNTCRRILRFAGYDVLVADDVAGGWRLFGQYNGGLDLLLVDVAMPDGTGPELVQAIREHRPQMPAVIMSATVDADVLGKYGLEDAAFLEKPFTAPQLREVVAQQLGAILLPSGLSPSKSRAKAGRRQGVNG